MENNKRKRYVLGVVFILVVGLIYFLFAEDINTVAYGYIERYQSQSSAGIKVMESVTVPGYVEYITDDTVEREVVYPTLSSVRAMLSIPRVHIQGVIVNGTTEETMNQGFWHYPSASPFANKGNVVIFGHRYLKMPPHTDTFYNLDKVRPGDEIHLTSVFDNVTYKVEKVFVVSSSDQSIVTQTEEAHITLVTCHPLWTSKQRLVVVGKKV